MILDREEAGEKEIETSLLERNMDWLPPVCTQTGGGTYNPGMCPDQESNSQSFGIWENAPTNQTNWPGLVLVNFMCQLDRTHEVLRHWVQHY